MLNEIDTRDVIRLQARYQTNPNLFNDAQVRELMMLSEAAGMTFKPHDSSSRVTGNIIGSVANSALAGIPDFIFGEGATRKFFGGGEVYGKGANLAAGAAGAVSGLLAGGLVAKGVGAGAKAATSLARMGKIAAQDGKKATAAARALSGERSKAQKAVLDAGYKKLDAQNAALLKEGMDEASLVKMAKMKTDQIAKSVKEAENRVEVARAQLGRASGPEATAAAQKKLAEATARQDYMKKVLTVKADSTALDALEASSRLKRGLPNVKNVAGDGKVSWSYADDAAKAAAAKRFSVYDESVKATKGIKPTKTRAEMSGFEEKMGNLANSRAGKFMLGDGKNRSILSDVIDNTVAGGWAGAGFGMDPVTGGLTGGAFGGLTAAARGAGTAGRLGLGAIGAGIGGGMADEDSRAIGALAGAVTPFMVGKAMKNVGAGYTRTEGAVSRAAGAAGGRAKGKGGLKFGDIADDYVNNRARTISPEYKADLDEIKALKKKGTKPEDIAKHVERRAIEDLAAGRKSLFSTANEAERKLLADIDGWQAGAAKAKQGRLDRMNAAQEEKAIGARMANGKTIKEIENEIAGLGVKPAVAAKKIDDYANKLAADASGGANTALNEVFDDLVVLGRTGEMGAVQSSISGKLSAGRSSVVEYYKGTGSRAGKLAEELEPLVGDSAALRAQATALEPAVISATSDLSRAKATLQGAAAARKASKSKLPADRKVLKDAEVAAQAQVDAAEAALAAAKSNFDNANTALSRVGTDADAFLVRAANAIGTADEAQMIQVIVQSTGRKPNEVKAILMALKHPHYDTLVGSGFQTVRGRGLPSSTSAAPATGATAPPTGTASPTAGTSPAPIPFP